MKKNTLKTLTSIVFTILSLFTYAQQQICVGEVKSYTVDTQSPDGGDPDGTPGSTYDWQVLEAGFAGVITVSSPVSNKADIDWATTPPGTYTIQVIETNGCEGLPVTLPVTINPAVVAPTVAGVSPICVGEDAVFTITGMAGDEVTYNINGGADVVVTIGASGTVDVTVPTPTNGQMVTLTNVKSGSCDLDINQTGTIVVTPTPVTTPINFDF